MFTEKNVLIDIVYKTVVDFYFKVQLINQFIIKEEGQKKTTN